MNLQQYIEDRVGKGIKENDYFGYQCVAQAKDYAKTVLGVTIGSFGGSALTGWANRSNTFPEHTWQKIYNNPSDPLQVPDAGDIIFFSGPDRVNGHVAVVSKQPKAGDTEFETINQNVGNGDGKNFDDYIKISTYNYNLVLGWYRLIKEETFEEFIESPVVIQKSFSNTSVHKGIKVRHKEHPTINTVNAFYSLSKRTIYLCARFFTHNTIEEQEAILDHEWGHELWYRLPKVIQDIWIMYHHFDEDFRGDVYKKLGYEYSEVRYLNGNAQRNEKESFCEFIELMTLDRLSGKETIFQKDDWLYLGYGLCKSIMKKVDNREIELQNL